MKAKRIITAAILILSLFCGLPSITASAASDLDFKILVDPVMNSDYNPAKHSEGDKFVDAKGRTYDPGRIVPIHVMVNNQTSKGYIYLEMRLKFNSDIFSLNTPPGKLEDGFSVKVVEDDPTDGTFVQILYNEDKSIATLSQQGAKYIKLDFIVLTKAAEGSYMFELVVDEKACLTTDEGGSWDYERKNPLTVSKANSKKVDVVSTEPGVDSEVSSSSPDYSPPYTTTRASTQTSGNGGGGIFAVIFIVLVMMALGVVGGFVLAQRRYGIEEPFSLAALLGRRAASPVRVRRPRVNNEDNYDRYGRTTSPRRGADRNESYHNDNYGGDYGDNYGDYGQSGASGTFDDEDGFGRGGRYADHPAPPPPVNTEDDIDPYFGLGSGGVGMSSISGAGSMPQRMREDDGFPDEFIPRKYKENQYNDQRPLSRSVSLDDTSDPEFDAYQLLDDRRNTRSDDGFGGFGGSDAPSSLGRAANDDDGYIPRRRHR